MRSLVLATLTSLLVSGTAPLANVAEQDGPTRIHLGKRIFEVGGRGPDILEASTRRTELVGGRGFDLLLAARGAARVVLGADGGVAMANGPGGTEFTIGHGFSVVVGSPGSDTVHVWGGINLVFLRSGDDEVVAHDGGGLSIVFGGTGTDRVSCIGACWTTWTGPDIERRSRNDAPAPSSSLVVLGVPRTHRSLLELDDEICDDAVSGSGSPIQQYGVEVWGVLDGADAGPEVTAYIPGGEFSWDDGTTVQTFAHWGRPPSLGEPRIFRLYRSEQLGVWIFERAENGYGVGEPIPLR